jgi:hypothetical protein
VTLNTRLRFEMYAARQEDNLPAEKTLNALGVVAKLYF